MRWLEFDSLVNARDVGGIPTVDGGEIKPGRLMRSDNLQALTAADIDRLLGLWVTDVIDLRSAYELHHEGPGPLVGQAGVTFHNFSYIPERYDRADAIDTDDVLPDNTDPADPPHRIDALAGDEPAGDESPGDAPPFEDKQPVIKVDDAFASTYLSFLAERPESVLGSLRAIAHAEGAALVHCAAGKDRTGTAVALALFLAGAEPEAVIADYAASSERIPLIVQRLLGSETYRNSLEGRPLESHATRPETMRAFLEYAEGAHGGVEPMLVRMGWSTDETAALRRKLRD